MLSAVEIRVDGGRVMIGPESIVPTHPHASFSAVATLNKLFHDRGAVSQLRRVWPSLALGGEHHQHMTGADMRELIERAIAHRRLNLLWIPPLQHEPLLIPLEFQPKPSPPAAPQPAGQAPRPIVQRPVDSLNLLEKVGLALEQALGRLAADAKSDTAALRKTAAALTAPQKAIVTGSLAIFTTPLAGELASTALLAVYSLRRGLDGARGVMDLVSACFEAAAAKGGADIDAAARHLAAALEHLGEPALAWLARGELAKTRPVRQAEEPAAAATAKPAAPQGGTPPKKALGGAVPPVKPPKLPAVVTGLGDKIDKHLPCSPTLSKNIEKLQKSGWTIVHGAAGGGSFADRVKKTITVDPNSSELATVRTLAHETGHALYALDPYVAPAGLTRAEYIAKNVLTSLKDEGEATLMNIQINQETNANCNENIGVSGKLAAAYEKVAAKFPNLADRDKAREEIGKLFAQGEHPSTDPTKTYEQYYEKPFAEFWDKHVAPTLKKP